VVVTVSLPVLQGHIGPASLALGGPVNAEAARRLACDAEIIPVVLGACGGSTSGAPAAPCPGDSPRGDPAPCRLHLAGCTLPAAPCRLAHLDDRRHSAIPPTTRG